MADKNLILMSGNHEVMSINMDMGYYRIINEGLMPYQLRGAIVDTSGMQNGFSLTILLPIINRNYQLFVGYLSRRVLSLDRKNAKQILNCVRLTQSQSDMDKAKISLMCRAVSVLDNYWVKLEGDNVTWEEVNVRRNSLSRTVAQVALHGTSLTLEGLVSTPELTTHGAYAKCWKRLDGELYLFKAGNERGLEPKLEIEASRVLDKTNVKHVVYEPAESEGVFCSKCRCMTDDRVSLIDARDFYSYCRNNSLDEKQTVFGIDADMMYKMGIVDYIIGNSDRHDGNWGFLYDSDTMQILGCHPLYDHNNAFNASILANDSSRYVVNGENILEHARMCVKNTDFRFVAPLRKSDFYYEFHFDEVIRRAGNLGIQIPTVPCKSNDKWCK
ncbi:MAG: hypothetical protein HFG79_06545 [Lachnospiraceae bacterium]|nr:hypothetical protein [Lachnospiraceae bacterium]